MRKKEDVNPRNAPNAEKRRPLKSRANCRGRNLMRFGPIELYKKLPKTNCGDCRQPSCLAFATQVVGYGQDLKECPHLDEATLQEVSSIIEEQRDRGVYVKKDNHKITRDHLRDKIQDHDFRAIASGLGVTYSAENGMEALEIPYFNRVVTMRHSGLWDEQSEGFDPWDEVLLYNYIFFSGSKPLSGKWVGLESFPNSLPKRVALDDGCHRRISETFSGARHALENACQELGGMRVDEGHSADLAFQFQPLPRMPLLLLFWDEDKEEGFESQAKVLFDASAMEYLDLEGLTFVAEKLADNLITRKGGV
jgi:hypothetical protein